MKATPIFIIIPDARIKGCTHHLLPYGIVRMKNNGVTTEIYYLQGGETALIETLLTAEEIHERLQQLEEQREIFLFGSFGEEGKDE